MKRITDPAPGGSDTVISKRGNGAFSLTIRTDGTYGVVIGLCGPTRTFTTARAAYDHFRPRAESNSSAWNVCYHLEDYVLREEAPKREEPKPLGETAPRFTTKYGDAPDAIRKRLDDVFLTGGIIADEYTSAGFRIAVVGFATPQEADKYKAQQDRSDWRFARRWHRNNGEWVSS